MQDSQEICGADALIPLGYGKKHASSVDTEFCRSTSNGMIRKVYGVYKNGNAISPALAFYGHS